MATQESPATSLRGRRWMYVGIALVALAASLTLVWQAEDTADVRVSEAVPAAPLVTTITVSRSQAVPTISAFAELRPRWDAQIRAAVSGRVQEVHEAALAGERVEAGALLFSIDKTQYEAAVAEAELSLERARLTEWQAKNAVTVARSQFKRAGKEPPNELALRLPELRIAERNVTAATAQLAAAEQRLRETAVTAPFAGIVVERIASLGQTVAAGEALVRLLDDEHFEAVVELTQTDWSLLAQPVAGSAVSVFHRDGRALGSATVREGGGFLDATTRQRRLYLDVPANGDQLLAGDFVRFAFTGDPIGNTLSVPESALSLSGHVWFVDADNRLARFIPRILFRSGAEFTFIAPSGSNTFRVAATPLASFLPGKRVDPQPAPASAQPALAVSASPGTLLGANREL